MDRKRNRGGDMHSIFKTKKVMGSMLLVGLISFPIFFVVKEWLVVQKRKHNEERKKIITELRRKQEDAFEEMERAEKLKESQLSS